MIATFNEVYVNLIFALMQMSSVLRQARILSSETDNTIKQDQQTNVNINIKPGQPRANSIPLYPNVQPLNPNVNFIQAPQPEVAQQVGPIIDTQTANPEYQSASPPVIDSRFQTPFCEANSPNEIVQDRGIADLGNELDELDKKNRFLEMLVEMYENNPLKVNSYIVCESKLLMEMIKLLTGCQKVELVLNEDIGCGGCCGAISTKSNRASPGKIIYVSKILVTKDGKTEDLKYAYNDIYSQFIKYAISLKMVC